MLSGGCVAFDSSIIRVERQKKLHFNSKGTASQKKAEADMAEICKKTFFTLAGGKEGSLSEFLCEKPI
tara:strand:+ start:442 stop:645 length:204 start_codon:yes stop_codon:yes gene_type:complete